jgi:hypothetical protein
MSDKLVYVKELKQGRSDKTNSTWPEITDQDNEIWRLFRQQIQVELGKAYLITFSKNERGFNDIEKITPLVNIFKQEALKEIANRNDVIRNYSIAITQSVQYYSTNGMLPDITKVFEVADTIFAQVNSVADKVMASIQTPKQEIK